MIKNSQTDSLRGQHSQVHLFYTKTFFAVAFWGLLAAGTTAMASPCYPNDPDGTNPGNLCLTYPPSWSPLPNTSTDQPPFVQAVGQPAYYGFPVSSTQPGTIIGRTDGFWTEVQAVNGNTTITDSKGNTFTTR
jgi:hypothetical protein